MEGQPMVSYTAGSMNSLLHKLTKMKTRLPALEALKRDLMDLKDNFFHKVAGRREMTLHAETWMKIVREIIYDIEDWFDQKPDCTGVQQLEILEDDVAQFKALIQHARELCDRYVEEVPAEKNRLHCTVDSPRKLRGEITGGENPTHELVELLTAGEKEEKRLRVVSIVGMEGLGKTTLAKEVYAKLQLEAPAGRFDCWASVSLGKRPSVRNTLMEILRQVKLCDKERGANPDPMRAAVSVGKQRPSSMRKTLTELLRQVKFCVCDKQRVKQPKPTSSTSTRAAQQDLHTLVAELWEYLGTKSYFILVDGIWSLRAWKLINCALPEKRRGSRVLTTTCMSNVARFCSIFPSHVYHMEPLGEEMSRSLYLESIRQGDQRSADGDEAMLNMCGGMPLAITVAVGLLLATGSENVPDPKILLGRTVLSSVEQCSTSQGMTKILRMSYAALSLPMQSCLLYLSFFRENYTIKKDRLVRLWIAEGYIPKEDKETIGEESLWERGERYFNELIIRRLIQPVFNYDDHQAVGCTVHSVILYFIKSLSSKGNFVTVGGAHLCINPIRRFSLDRYDDENKDGDGTLASMAMHLYRVRSVTVLRDIEGINGRSALTESGEIGGGPVLPRFKLLRVLDLEGTISLGSHHLEGIGGLVLLKYLGVAGTDIDKLPKDVGELEQLETLDLRRTKLRTLPKSIVKQKRLAHLLTDYTVKIPSGIQKMHGLEEVSTIGVHSETSLVELLRRLRVLGIKLDRGASRVLREVASCTKLTSLSLDCHYEDLLSYPLFCPPDQLRRFELKIYAPVPTEELRSISSLVSVTHLDIEIMELDHRVVRQLGELPNLVLLK